MTTQNHETTAKKLRELLETCDVEMAELKKDVREQKRYLKKFAEDCQVVV